MNTFKTVATLALVIWTGLGSSACRKRSAQPAAPAGTDAPPAGAPAAAPGAPATPPPPAPALSSKDETEIRKRFVPKEVPWAQRTPTQKDMTYFSWCQIYMLGDAATKAKVLAEINQTGLSAEDREALKKKNRSMNIPLMPL